MYRVTPDRDRRLLRGSPIVVLGCAAALFVANPSSGGPAAPAAPVPAADVQGTAAPFIGPVLASDVESIRFNPVGGLRAQLGLPLAAPAQPLVTTTAQPGTAAARAIEFALAQRGLPYVWGGDGPQNGEGGFDCSGLTTAAYAYAGIALPRTAHTQYYAGPHVPAGAPLLPGDLVFYGVPERVHHVGLYLGDGMMVNAPRRGKPVQIAYVRYAGDDYLGATRPAAGIDAGSEGLIATPDLPVAVPPVPSPAVPPAPEEFPAPAVPESALVPPPAVEGTVQAPPFVGPTLTPTPGAGTTTPGTGTTTPGTTTPGTTTPGPGATTPGTTTPGTTTPGTTTPSTTTPAPTTTAPTTTTAPATTTPAAAVGRPASVRLPGGTVSLASAERDANGLPATPSSTSTGGLRWSPAEGTRPARAVVSLHPDAAVPGTGDTVTLVAADGTTTSLTIRSSSTVTAAAAADRAAARGEGTRLVLVRTNPTTNETTIAIAE